MTASPLADAAAEGETVAAGASAERAMHLVSMSFDTDDPMANGVYATISAAFSSILFLSTCKLLCDLE